MLIVLKKLDLEDCRRVSTYMMLEWESQIFISQVRSKKKNLLLNNQDSITIVSKNIKQQKK